ncbi:MAG: class I SAM-dependent methyltransferase [Anaerolineae bacterium]
MEPGLDHAFLQYIGVTSENQTAVRQFYLPMFNGCRRVADLGCGGGDFVALLRQAGIDALGVDSDPVACEDLRRRNLPVVEQDAIAYLESAPEASLDGIYSAHMVEHMPYQAVLTLIRLSHRALRPGGRIVLATPNPRALVSHLELYHMHFGHVAFYHPRLLSFFMDYCGFERIDTGENPATASPLLKDGAALPVEDALRRARVTYRPEFPPVGNPLRKLIRRGKTVLFRFVVQPFLDEIVADANRVLTAQQADLQRIKALDRPFECYAIGYKPAPNGEADGR